MNAETSQMLRRRVETIDSLPTVPTILRPLLQYIEQPVEEMEIRKIVEMVACDEALAAQCLRLANSPLYSRLADVSSLRGAVLALGVRRLRDLLLSCCLLRLFPSQPESLDPLRFWEHSFGCALLSRHLAQKLSYPDPERAYLAGLLHDCGKLACLVCVPAQFRAVVERVRSGGMSLCEAERLEMGFTHSESGQALGEHWRLPDEIVDVIAWHHEVEQAKRNVALTALVHLADELCLRHGLDNGLPEPAETDLREDPAWNLLTRVYPYLSEADLEQFHLEMKEFTRQVTAMVGSLFGAHRAA